MPRSITYGLLMLATLMPFHGRAADIVNWKLILKDGSMIECSGAPLIINGAYMFRRSDGKDDSVSADRLDLDKTNQANKVEHREPERASDNPERPRPAAFPATAPLLADADFRSQVLQSDTPVLVEFWASWCGYCRKFEPTLRAIGGEYAGRLRVVKVDIDRSPAIARQYSVFGTPTLLLFKDGQVAGMVIGYAPKARVVRLLQTYL